MTATMVGASSSTSTTQQGKRKKRATWSQHTKKQRHPQAIGTEGVAIPVEPLQMAFPITGVNGAAPRWSTVAALGAASIRAAGLPLPPVMVGANGPDAHGLQALGAAASVNGVATAAALVLAYAAGQLVPVPVRFYGYMSMATGAAPPADGTPALPLAAALDRFRSTTLARMLSVLMPSCHPPLRQHESRSGAPPRWWPTASEHWWVPEVVAHLPRMPPATPVPFVAGKLLKKAHRVAVLVAIVKHLSPDFARITAAVRHCGLSASEAALWNSALENEQAWCVWPVFVVQLQQHAAGDCNHLPPSGNVVNDAVTVTDGVTRPADNGGQVVAAAELKQPQEQHSGGVAPADGCQEVANLAGDDGAHIGAMVATPTAGAEPEKPQTEQDGDVDATIFATSDLGDQQLEDMLVPLPVEQADDLHQLADDRSFKDIELSGAAAKTEEELDDRPWYENEELRRKFANMPIGSPHSFDYGWYF